jgi:hypothetical protein
MPTILWACEGRYGHRRAEVSAHLVRCTFFNLPISPLQRSQMQPLRMSTTEKVPPAVRLVSGMLQDGTPQVQACLNCLQVRVCPKPSKVPAHAPPRGPSTIATTSDVLQRAGSPHIVWTRWWLVVHGCMAAWPHCCTVAGGGDGPASRRAATKQRSNEQRSNEATRQCSWRAQL